MNAIKTNGVITHYEDWKHDVTSAEDVFNNIMSIQAQQLADWKIRLNDVVYAALAEAVRQANEGLSASTHNAYDSIKRGQSLDTFINNWRPNKPINEIYW